MLNNNELQQVFNEALDNHVMPYYTGNNWTIQPLEDGIVTYSVVGFEAYSFISLDEAMSMGRWHKVLNKQLEHVNVEDVVENDYIDYVIQVNTHKGIIEAKAIYAYAVTIHSEAIDYDNFSEQVKRFLDLF